jgi:hypothetical protein
MKNLKTLFTIAFALIISLSINAQEKGTDLKTQKIENKKQLKIAKEKLKLSPEQEVKFKEISKNYKNKIKSIKDSDIDKKDKKQQIKDLRSQKDLEMKSFLNESQFKTYLDLKEERKENMIKKLKK